MYTTASVSFVVSPYSYTVASVVSSYDPDDALKPHCRAKSSMVFDVIGPIRVRRNDDAVGRGGSGLVGAGFLVEAVHQEHRAIAVFDRNRGIVVCGAGGAVDVGHVPRRVFPVHAVAVGGIQRSGITKVFRWRLFWSLLHGS